MLSATKENVLSSSGDRLVFGTGGCCFEMCDAKKEYLIAACSFEVLSSLIADYCPSATFLLLLISILWALVRR